MASGLVFVFARPMNSPVSLGEICIFILSGVVLEFFAIAPERVRISIHAFIGFPSRREEAES